MLIEAAIKEYCKNYLKLLSSSIVPTDECGYWNINVQFTNLDGMDDETQFDIKPYKFDYGVGKCAELVELWKDFCKENGFKQNSVTSVSFANM